MAKQLSDEDGDTVFNDPVSPNPHQDDIRAGITQQLRHHNLDIPTGSHTDRDNVNNCEYCLRKFEEIYATQRLTDKEALLGKLPEEMPQTESNKANSYINRNYFDGEVNGHNKAIRQATKAIKEVYETI